MRGLICCFAVIVGAVCAPGLGQAAVYTSDHCQVIVPNDWVASKSRSASADKKEWATLMSAPTAAEIIQVETGLGAKPAGDAHGISLYTTTLSFGGKTNVAYIAVSHTTPSCMAQVTSPPGAGEAASKQIALTVKPGG